MKKLIIAALMLSLAMPAFAAAPAAPAKASTVSGSVVSTAGKVDAKPAKDTQAGVKSDASGGGKLINKNGKKKP